MSKAKKPKNPVSDKQGKWKEGVFRGGGWGDGARGARLSFRYGGVPGYRNRTLGFRIVKNTPKKEKRDE